GQVEMQPNQEEPQCINCGRVKI
ncbi:uncharacterized protein METZ01_LOCUS142814, partial [marine metagenome]